MMNLFLVVTSIQFQKTKKKEAERKKKLNNYLQSTGDSEEGSFWEEILKIIIYSTKKIFTKFLKKCCHTKDAINVIDFYFL